MKKMAFTFLGVVFIAALALAYFFSTQYQPQSMYSYFGKVADLEGRPISGAAVDVYTETGETYSSFSDEKGEYRVLLSRSSAEKIKVSKRGLEFAHAGLHFSHMKPIDFLGWDQELSKAVGSFPDHRAIAVTQDVKANLGSLGALSLSCSAIGIERCVLSLRLERGEMSYSNDLIPKMAPPNGYEKVLKEDDFKKSSNPTQLVYFRLSTPDEGEANDYRYGWIRYAFKPQTHQGPLFLIFDWGWNTEGARFLHVGSDATKSVMADFFLGEY